MADNNKDVDYAGSSPAKPDAGPFLAKVVGHLDSTYMGELEVEILRDISPGSTAEGKPIRAKMISPFWGQTGAQFVGEDPDDYNNTQKSYGMWFVPPDVGSIVIVIYIRGNPADPYWIGCVPDKFVNFMVPGIASTQYNLEGDGRLPVAEYNKKVNQQISDPTQAKKPVHPIADVLKKQGLIKDDVRGITTSSARRETPSSVFGISTPGPVDKKSGAKQGKVGKTDEQATVFVSRLGGTTFVMDDGDDKFLRKTKADAGGPVYVAVEQGETGGLPDVPHNELVRIRTRTGHQILMHNSEDLIYIGNAKGTTWIEMTSLGKIDIYAEDSISIHTKQDFNVTADRDINLTATGNINMTAGGNVDAYAKGNLNLDGKYAYINSGKAGQLKAGRVPQAEPWGGHENYNPAPAGKAAKTATAPPAPPGYSTTTDTFSKIKPPEEKKE